MATGGVRGGRVGLACVLHVHCKRHPEKATRQAVSYSSCIMGKILDLIRKLAFFFFTFKYCRRASSSAFLIVLLYTVSNLEMKT